MRDPNIFGQCLVDSDPASNRRSRDRRRKALLVALILEAIALAVLLLAPLAKTEIMPGMLSLTPIPPFRGLQPSRAAPNRPHQEQPTATTLLRIIRDGFTQPHSIPKGVRQLTADESSSVEDVPSIGKGIPGGGNSFGIPGGSDSGPAFVPPCLRFPSRPPGPYAEAN